jgi:hypothetical protein
MNGYLAAHKTPAWLRREFYYDSPFSNGPKCCLAVIGRLVRPRTVGENFVDNSCDCRLGLWGGELQVMSV